VLVCSIGPVGSLIARRVGGELVWPGYLFIASTDNLADEQREDQCQAQPDREANTDPLWNAHSGSSFTNS